MRGVIICRTSESGEDEFLSSFIMGTWTTIPERALAFKNEDLAEKTAELLANQADIPTWTEYYRGRQ